MAGLEWPHRVPGAGRGLVSVIILPSAHTDARVHTCTHESTCSGPRAHMRAHAPMCTGTHSSTHTHTHTSAGTGAHARLSQPSLTEPDELFLRMTRPAGRALSTQHLECGCWALATSCRPLGVVCGLGAGEPSRWSWFCYGLWRGRVATGGGGRGLWWQGQRRQRPTGLASGPVWPQRGEAVLCER